MAKKRKRGFFDDFFGFDEFERLHEEMNRMMERMMKLSLVPLSEDELEKLAKKPNTYVYGYSIRIGPDGKPIIREFGNIKPEEISKKGDVPLNEEREPLVDIMEDDKNVTIVVELPGVDKNEIDLRGNGKELKIKVDGKKRKYHKVLQLPDNVKFDKAKATYNNGVLEIKMPKTKKASEKEKKIPIE